METKEILYEGLIRAIEFNHKLTPHLLIFIDWHFRSYFSLVGGELQVKFDRIVVESDGHVDVWDDIGKLIIFVATCVMTCEQPQFSHDVRIVVDLLHTVREKVTGISIQSLNLQKDRKSMEIGKQYLSLLEGIMAYTVMASEASSSANNMEKFQKIFNQHQKFEAEMNNLFAVKKSTKKPRKDNNRDCSTVADQDTITAQGAGNTQCDSPDTLQFKRSNIWGTNIVETLLNWMLDADKDCFSTDADESEKFKVYLLKVTTSQIESFRHAPDYRHVKHSRRMFSFLCQVSKALYLTTRKITEFDNADRNQIELTLECFHQCLLTAETVYKKKLDRFFMQIFAGEDSFQGHIYHELILVVIDVVHKLIDLSIKTSCVETKKINASLLGSLQILYSLLPPEHAECAAVASWLYNFCLKNNLDGLHLDGIFKLLFTQRLKYFDGDFFASVAIQLSKIFTQISTVEGVPSFELATITEITAEAVLGQLCTLIKNDIEDVEFTLLKVKSIAAKIKFLGEKGVDDDRKYF